jgi:hypothetical protein
VKTEVLAPNTVLVPDTVIESWAIDAPAAPVVSASSKSHFDPTASGK